MVPAGATVLAAGDTIVAFGTQGAADRVRMLERFEQGTGTNGSGLGLAIARQVAIAHGGSIAIDDSPFGGARVGLRFGASSKPTGAMP